MIDVNNPFLLGKVKYVKGNASRPQTGDNRTIVLFCTDDGEFEKVEGNEQVFKTWEKARSLYRAWWRGKVGFKLGAMQTNQIMSDTEVAHLVTCVGNDGEGNDGVFFAAEETKKALEALAKHCSVNKKNVHINKCGTENEWKFIESAIASTLLKSGVSVFIYE